MRLNASKIINYKIISIIWVFIWLLFFIRGFLLVDYKIFKNSLVKDIEGKRRYLMKEGLYDFIVFCQKRIPEKDDYTFVYNPKALDPVERSRAAYYLYPRKMREGAPYIMVFGVSGYGKRGFEFLDKFNETSFILHKRD